MSSKDLTLNQKKEWAQHLYISGQYTQKEISVKVNVSEKTLSKWVTTEKWAALKKSLLTSKNELLSFFYDTLQKIREKISNNGDGIGDTKLADMVIKYTAAINNLETETSTAEQMEVARMYINYLMAIESDPEFILKSTMHLDAFIKAGLKRF